MFLVYSRNKSTTAMPELIFYVTCFYFFGFVFSLTLCNFAAFPPWALDAPLSKHMSMGSRRRKCAHPYTRSNHCQRQSVMENLLMCLRFSLTANDAKARSSRLTRAQKKRALLKINQTQSSMRMRISCELSIFFSYWESVKHSRLTGKTNFQTSSIS